MASPPAAVRSVFATNSILGMFGVGGPGAHLAEVLAREFGPAVAFSRGRAESLPGDPEVRVLERPLWRRTLARTRFARMQVRSQKAERLEFDRLCARAVPPCRVAILENSTSLRTLRRVKAGGARVAVKYNNPPFARMMAEMREERSRWGGPAPFIDEELVECTRAETREADAVLVTSRWVEGLLAEDGVPPGKIRYARYGIDAERFRPPARPPEEFVVASVGWLDLYKGYPYLVEAFRDAAIPGARLLLHGGTNVRFHHDLVARLRGDSAVEVVRGDVLETYGRASVLVLPSVADSFGNVVPEAMACGMPVIVSDLCGAMEWVTEGVDGFVVPARNSAAIREHLLRLHGDPVLRRRMGEAARRKALSMPWSLFQEDVRTFVRELEAS